MTQEEREKTDSYLKNIVLNLPECPGCYQYLNEQNEIIYVGKARNLKRRVYSYFSKEHDNRKTALLVQKIRDIKYIVVKTEEDALLLENNLIKRYKPRYNVLLKDDKTYPSICITNEYFPRIFKTRQLNHNAEQSARSDCQAVSAAHLFLTSFARIDRKGEIQGLPGISYQELLRTLCRQYPRGAIHEIHSGSQRDSERQHRRTLPTDAGRDADLGTGDAF